MENLEAYKAYLDHERALGDGERLCTLYERALEDHPTRAWLWREYIRFLKGKEKALDTCRRAVQHCPTSAGLWTLYMRFAERMGASHDVIDGNSSCLIFPLLLYSKHANPGSLTPKASSFLKIIF